MRKFLTALILLAFVGATPVLAVGEEGTPDPVDIIILVDESASLSSAAVRSEKEALQEIIGSYEISQKGVRLGILPFSSGEGSPRSVPECDLTETDPSGIESLTKCASQVVRQRQRGRADTDFAQAIEAAISNFSNSNATKVIVLLTDGKYDPDGNESISSAEQGNLDRVLLEAKEKTISLWALGFGKADLKALQSYSDMTSDGGATCAAPPTAVLAKDLNLKDEFKTIIDFATCTGHISGSANPDFDFLVSPLLSKINIEAIAKSGSLRDSSVIVKDANGERMCEETEIVSGRWRCSETLTGENAGEWTLTDRTGKGLSVDITSTGRINIEVTDCKVEEDQAPSPHIRISRADGEKIDFNIDGMTWPKIEYKVGRETVDDVRSGSIELDSLETEILGSSDFSPGDKITVNLDSKGDPSGQLLLRVKQISTCSILSQGTTTTSSSTTTTVVTPPTTLAPDCKLTNSCPPPPPPPPYWLLIVIALLAVGGFFAWKKMGKKFPEGAELQFQNQFNKSVFLTAENIGGQRKVYFTADLTAAGSIEVLVGLAKTDARYVMTRDGDEFIKIVSLFTPEVSSDEENDLDGDPVVEVGEPLSVLNGEQFNVRSCDAPNVVGKTEQVMLRVLWLEDEDL